MFLCRSSLAGYRLPSPAFPPTSPYPSLAASPLSPFGPSPGSLFGAGPVPSSTSSSPVITRSPAASKHLQQHGASPARTHGPSLFNSVPGLVSDSPRYVVSVVVVVVVIVVVVAAAWIVFG